MTQIYENVLLSYIIYRTEFYICISQILLFWWEQEIAKAFWYGGGILALESDTAHHESQPTCLLVVEVCPPEETDVTVWPSGLSPNCQISLHLMYLNHRVKTVEDCRLCNFNLPGSPIFCFMLSDICNGKEPMTRMKWERMIYFWTLPGCRFLFPLRTLFLLIMESEEKY